MQDKDNPHEVSAEQAGAYDKDYINDLETSISNRIDIVDGVDIAQNNRLDDLENE